MSFISSTNMEEQSGNTADVYHGVSMKLAHWNWEQHYQAETVDLRYFFHSGWSS